MAITLCALVAVLDGFDTFSISFVAPVIAKEWGVDRSQFGPIFSSALVGLLIGALTLGAAADKFGRRKIIIASTIAFGIFAFLTGFSESTNQLLLFRFLTGLGLGGAIPNIIALTTEYSPTRIKTLTVVIMFSGFPLGGLLGGILSANLIMSYGWQSVFFFGGVAPMILAIVLIAKLPESIPYLVGKQGQHDRVVRSLRLISPDAGVDKSTTFSLPTAETGGSGPAIGQLFADNRTVGTLMLWVLFYCNLLMFYFLGQWLPTVLSDAGLPIRLAIIAAVLLNAGSVSGGVVVGWLVDRYGPYRVLPLSYLAAAAATASIGIASQNLYAVGTAVFFAGMFVGGGQLIANALASNFYPATVRSTGVAWAVGWSRIGAICGPLLAGWLIAKKLGYDRLFVIAAIPALIASAAVFYMGKMSSVRPSD